MLRRLSGILLCAGLLCVFAPTAGAVAIGPAFDATYWWMGDGSTVRNNGETVDNAIVKVHQLDYYRDSKTYFTYDLYDLTYTAPNGHNGLSGFEVFINPFTYAYSGALPVDPLTQNPWLAVEGPDNVNKPEWDALWGFDVFDPSLKNTFGLYPVGAVGAALPLNHAVFGFVVDGEVAIGDVDANIYSWGDDPVFGPAPVDYHSGRVSGPVPGIPEPGTLLLLGMGIAGLVVARRRA